MQITTDRPAYDALQRYLVGVIADDVRELLHEAASRDASIDDAVSAITLGLATIIDGRRGMSFDGRPVIPVLMFGTVDGADAVTDVLSDGGPSRLHEYAADAATPPASQELPFITMDEDEDGDND